MKAKHMDIQFCASPNKAVEKICKTGRDPSAEVEDAKLETVDVMCVKQLKLLWVQLLCILVAKKHYNVR